MGARIVGTCASGKKRYPTEVEGMIALANARAHRERQEKRGKTVENVEVRYYPCPRCKGWHTTHLSEAEYQAKREESGR